MADTTIRFYEELIEARAGVQSMAGEAEIRLVRCPIGSICWIDSRSVVQAMVSIAIMADTTICFDEELNGARAGVQGMAGEANRQLAGVSIGNIGWIWNHGTVQKMVPVEDGLMIFR